MILCIADVLSRQDLDKVHGLLKKGDFYTGTKTAGWAAREVKSNLQLTPKSEPWPALQELVRGALKRHELFSLAAAPKTISALLFSKYEKGMGYGDHVDNAVMGGDRPVRSDMSFTLFLQNPEEYEGGELAIEDTQGIQTFKLLAGSMILYPSTSLHRVETVTKGTRTVAVGWVQSMVREAGKRQILFDLETLRRQMFAQNGKTSEFDMLSKNVSNLWRMWTDL